MLARTLFFAAAWLAASAAVQAQSTPFDGPWNVVLTCPPHHEEDDAKGYTHRFAATVTNGQFRGTHGAEGEPGWHLLTGPIAADGAATLRLEGIVNSAEHAINNAQRGKSYKYRVKARFEPDAGSGERMSGRVCTFRFVR